LSRRSLFLDLGGSASAEHMKAAFNILGRNVVTRSVPMSMFGDITRCDEGPAVLWRRLDGG